MVVVVGWLLQKEVSEQGERGGGVLAGEVGVGEGGGRTALCSRCAS